jgi:hypothetical protein
LSGDQFPRLSPDVHGPPSSAGFGISRVLGSAAPHDTPRIRWYETGAKLHTTHCEIVLAESYLVDGEVAVAGKHLAAARTHRTSYDENYLAAEIQRLEALLLLREGAPFAIVREHLTNGMGIACR